MSSRWKIRGWCRAWLSCSSSDHPIARVLLKLKHIPMHPPRHRSVCFKRYLVPAVWSVLPGSLLPLSCDDACTGWELLQNLRPETWLLAKRRRGIAGDWNDKARGRRNFGFQVGIAWSARILRIRLTRRHLRAGITALVCHHQHDDGNCQRHDHRRADTNEPNFITRHPSSSSDNNSRAMQNFPSQGDTACICAAAPSLQ